MTTEAVAPATETAAPPQTIGETVLKLDPKERSLQMIVYKIDGRAGSVRFSKSLFPKGGTPETITFPGGIFGVAPTERPKETPEERKARLAARPKPTQAERIARLEKKLAKMRAQTEVEAAVAAEAAQPVGAGA